MKRKYLKNVITPYAGVWGGQVATDAEGAPAPSTLPAATAFLISWAGTYWPETDPDSYEWGLGKRGMEARHKESGVLYRIRVGMPFDGEASSGISAWCVRDGRLVLLADKDDRVASAHAATYSYMARKVEYAGPPSDGAIIQ